MDQQWLNQQRDELGATLLEQGLSLELPVIQASSKTDQGGHGGELNSLIDHTVLKPEAATNEIERLCAEAKEYGFASVCINPRHVALAASLLKGSSVKVCTVIGFPLGATTTLTKVLETRDALANGATEVDMVIPIGALKERDYAYVYRDILGVVESAKGTGEGRAALVKVILETSLLTKEEIVKACLLAKMAGADFVKTSTGFGGGGASVEDIALMRLVVGQDLGVKASGGVRDREKAQALVQAGATRIGASAGVAIVQGSGGGSGY